jgi:hypothetical protein
MLAATSNPPIVSPAMARPCCPCWCGWVSFLLLPHTVCENAAQNVYLVNNVALGWRGGIIKHVVTLASHLQNVPTRRGAVRRNRPAVGQTGCCHGQPPFLARLELRPFDSDDVHTRSTSVTMRVLRDYNVLLRLTDHPDRSGGLPAFPSTRSARRFCDVA